MLQKIMNIRKIFQRRKQEVHVSVDNVHGIRCLLHVTNLALFGVVLILIIASSLIYYLIPITDVSELSKTVDVQETGAGLDTESSDPESVNVDSKAKEMIKNEAFSVINERNVFSHNRKEWVVKAVIPKSSELKNKRNVRADLAKKALAKKKAQAGKPKKIILHGVVLAGSIKKALINNPLKGVSKKKTMYVEEGDELEGYKVTSIEKDLIRLDWHGEEIVVMLYSGLKNLKQGANTGKGKQGGLTKLEYKYSIVEDVHEGGNSDVCDVEVEKVANADTLDEALLDFAFKEPEFFSMPDFESELPSIAVGMQDVAKTFPDIESNDVDTSKEELEAVTKLEYKFKVIDDDPAKEDSDVGNEEVEKVAHAEVLDETSLNPVYKGPESFSMPSLGDVPLSEAVEMKDVAGLLPDTKSNNTGFSNEGINDVRAEMPESVDLVAEEVIKQKATSENPSEILLHGIVIVTSRDIKKALVNIPMSPFRKERTLYVEEGDAFEGFKVTSIEPDLLRLDWQGKEMIVKFPLL